MRLAALALFFQLAAPHTLHVTPHVHKVVRDTSVNYVVIHYDSATTFSDTRRWLWRKKLAYNYLIKRDGTVVEFLDPKYKGSHAGVSYWDGNIGMNNHSIGICLQNVPPTPYTPEQYDSLAWLIIQLEQRWPDVGTHQLLGHSDIALPRGRKQDPGNHFRWAYLDSIIDANRHLTSIRPPHTL